MISTVDVETRHGHKTSAHGFDGYKGHVGIDPDSEIITATEVSAGNSGDASAAEDRIGDLLDEHTTDTEHTTDAGHADGAQDDGAREDRGDREDTPSVYGDNAYGTGAFHDRLEQAGIESKCKTQKPVAAGGLFSKDRFDIDLDQNTVTCPAGWVTPIRPAANGAGIAGFGEPCDGCPLRQQCTTSPAGRSIHVGAYERQLVAARARQRDPDWIADYQATRPKVERKIAHLMRRRHGGRRARMRGTTKIAADFALLAAAGQPRPHARHNQDRRRLRAGRRRGSTSPASRYSP